MIELKKIPSALVNLLLVDSHGFCDQQKGFNQII